LTKKQGFLTQKTGNYFRTYFQTIFAKKFCEFEKTGYFKKISELRKSNYSETRENSVQRRALQIISKKGQIATKIKTRKQHWKTVSIPKILAFPGTHTEFFTDLGKLNFPMGVRF